MTFDGWDARYYGDCLTYGQDSLMHFRTKGSKNGVRRYQNPDGTWTELGLKERRIREGFGERLAARREARRARRIEKKAARAAIRSANWERAMKYKAEQAELKRKRNPKNLTDEELNRGIERLKKEAEYRELNAPAAVKLGRSLVEGYFKAKEAKAQRQEEALKREERRYQMVTNQINAKAKLKEAQSKNKDQINEMVSNFIPTRNSARKSKARAEYLKEKKDYADFKTKNTIRGAIQKSISNIISKEGNRFVKEMSEESRIMKGGRFVKRNAKRVAKGTGRIIKKKALEMVNDRVNGFNPDQYDRDTRIRMGL